MSETGLDLLVVDDEPTQRRMISEYLVEQGHRVREAGEGEEALRLLGNARPDLVLTDVRLPGIDGVELLRRARKQGCDAEFLVMTAFVTVENAVEAMRAGAYDYLTKPISLEALDAAIARVQKKRRAAAEPAAAPVPPQDDAFERHGEAMRQVCALIDRVAPTDATVLIAGESGVGKERLADRLHAKSRRAAAPFLKINCAALTESLLEAELFGHEKGAFTGADRDRPGLFEAADKGTLLLDEIGDMPASLQVRLLRVIQEREVMRVGSRKPVSVDVRLVAATHHILEDLVKKGAFREDLYYRLRVIEVEVPPLRDRPEDIAVLAEKLLRRHAARNALPHKPLSTEALGRLTGYEFPGNVRELENMLERALILAGGNEIAPCDLPLELQGKEGAPAPRTLPDAVEALERSWIQKALDQSGQVRARAARLLGIQERVLRYKMNKYGL